MSNYCIPDIRLSRLHFACLCRKLVNTGARSSKRGSIDKSVLDNRGEMWKSIADGSTGDNRALFSDWASGPVRAEMELRADNLHFLSSPFAEPLVLIYTFTGVFDVSFFTCVMEVNVFSLLLDYTIFCLLYTFIFSFFFASWKSQGGDGLSEAPIIIILWYDTSSLPLT